MSVQSFIPTIWSETLQKALNQKYIGVANCSREYEGDIRKKGNRVKILNVGDVNISNYNANSNMSAPQTLDGTSVELTIDRAKYFNFQLDDVDRAQAVPGLMEAAMKNAAAALSKEADQYVYSLENSAGFNLTCNLNDDPANIVGSLLKARTKLFENGVTSADDIVFELSPKVAEYLLKAEINLSSENNELLETGCIGKIAGCKVYVSNNVHVEEGGSNFHHYCYARSRRAIAFAEQLSEIEAYRPELRFADAVKGLHLYGAKAIYPLEFGVIDCLIET